ncbi:hypothetical protein A2U01_0106885, partial [Trifolium medium]|nr:hypothetical protein [Trifolium medium]
MRGNCIDIQECVNQKKFENCKCTLPVAPSLGATEPGAGSLRKRGGATVNHAQ